MSLSDGASLLFGAGESVSAESDLGRVLRSVFGLPTIAPGFN
jgi:hypothetical protein